MEKKHLRTSVAAAQKHVQGYREKPVYPTCGNCMFSGVNDGNGNLFCMVGRFSVKRSATCKKHQLKRGDQ